MSAQRNLEVGQAALGVDVPERAHTVDDEAVVLDRSLEALQAVPCGAQTPVSKRTRDDQTREGKEEGPHRSCSGGRSACPPR